jgi:SNF2 family DNA or RNA helicase
LIVKFDRDDHQLPYKVTNVKTYLSAWCSASTFESTSASSAAKKWSFEQLLKEVEQIYPRHATQPAGLLSSVVLKPYQLQSLAFMQDMEANGPVGDVYVPRIGTKRGSLVVADGPTRLRPGNAHVRGGWLCDEMGMGKTMCLISLVLSNPPPPETKPGARKRINTVVVVPVSLLGQWSDEIKKFAPSLKVLNLHQSAKERVTRETVEAADIILTTKDLAPSRLARAVGHHMKKDELDRDRGDCYLPIHRLVVDEIHVLPAPESTTHLKALCGYSPSFVWLLTGTPISKSMGDLKGGALLLGHWSHGLKLSAHRTPKREVADLLKQLMIRHTMEQRLGSGDKALALPDATTETVWLDMSADERAMYHAASTDEKNHRTWLRMMNDGGRVPPIEMRLGQRRAACCNIYFNISSHNNLPEGEIPMAGGIYGTYDETLYTREQMLRLCKPHGDDPRKYTYSANVDRCTKLRALRRDLNDLREEDAGMHAVVFTTCVSAHRTVVAMLRDDRFAICEFSGTTQAVKRHEAIRNFQDTAEAKGGSPVAKVFVITIKTGSVGITLTAATRVYLLEPALDPATEVQAAGRIRRLGQTRGVLIKRFAFKNSLDEHICELHEAVKDGRVKIRDGVIPRKGMSILNGEGSGAKAAGPGAYFANAIPK